MPGAGGSHVEDDGGGVGIRAQFSDAIRAAGEPERGERNSDAHGGECCVPVRAWATPDPRAGCEPSAAGTGELPGVRRERNEFPGELLHGRYVLDVADGAVAELSVPALPERSGA